MLSSRNINHGYSFSHSHSHGFGRPRSGTAGSADNEPPPQSAPPLPGPVRPPHLRSRSWLSPVDPKPRNAVTMPLPSKDAGVNGHANETGKDGESGRLPRVHLPSSRHTHGLGHKSRQSQDVRSGSGDEAGGVTRDGSQTQYHLQHLGLNIPVQVKQTHSHRHTRSELPRGSGTDAMTNDGLLHPSVAAIKGGSMLTRMATNLSSRGGGGEGRQHKPHHQHSSSDFHRNINAAANAGIPLAGRPDIRRRATSDPRLPAFQRGMGLGAMQAQFGVANYIDGVPPPERPKPMSEVEVLLNRADREKKQKERNATEADVQKLTTQLAESNVELQGQLADANYTAQNLMRRLDEAFETLLQTASSMMDTISSFQNLSTQSDTLIKNFDHRTAALDAEFKAVLERHRAALFEERGAKISELEGRGKRANQRAEDMSRRLENCRVIIKNFSNREQTKRKAWKGVLLGSLWGMVLIFVGVFFGFGLWTYKLYGPLIRHDVHEAIAIALEDGLTHCAESQLHEVVKEQLHAHTDGSEEQRLQILQNLPDDVKAVLDDIAQRHNDTFPSQNEATKKWHVLPNDDPSAIGDIDDNKKLKKLFDKLEL